MTLVLSLAHGILCQTSTAAVWLDFVSGGPCIGPSDMTSACVASLWRACSSGRCHQNSRRRRLAYGLDVLTRALYSPCIQPLNLSTVVPTECFAFAWLSHQSSESCDFCNFATSKVCLKARGIVNIAEMK